MGGHGTAIAGALPIVQAFARAVREGLPRSGKPVALVRCLDNTQCTQVIFGAAGLGASGPSTISASLSASAGTSLHASGGE